MEKNRAAGVLSIILCFWLPALLHAQIQSLETPNLRLIYFGKAQEYVVPHVARCYENALKFHRRLFDYTPREKTTVLLEDFGDFANGAAGAMPNNFITVRLAPFKIVYETMTPNDRMNLMMNHELAHIFTMDKKSSSDRFYRSVFLGKVAPTAENPLSMIYSTLTSPRVFTPGWYAEGAAVFLETWMAGGLGRAFSPYDEMVFRTMVRDHRYIYDTVGLESEGTKVDFQVGANSYLYGTRIMSYLALQHGPEKLLAWIKRSDGSKRNYVAQFKKVYGVPLDEEWSRWIQWERQWQQANLDSIRKFPITPYRQISDKALGSVSRAFYDAGARKLYVAIRYPGQAARLAALDVDTGALERIGNVNGASLFDVTSLAYDQKTGALFYTTNNNGWRHLMAVDLKTGKSRRLIKEARVGDLAFNQADQSLWGVRHFNGISTLVRISHPYREWNQIYSWPYGKDIFDLDLSPDGTTLTAALAEVDGTQRLIKMETEKLLKGDNAFEVLFDFEVSTPANFVFSTSGQFLFGSSYYSGVSNIYRYDFANKKMEIVSNDETGLFRPVPVSEDSLIVMRYTGKGFVPAMIPIRLPENVSAIKFLGNEVVNLHPVVKEWNVGSPAAIQLDSLNLHKGTYNTLKNLALGSVYPIVEGYKDSPAFGVRLNFSDKTGLSGLQFSGSYSPDEDLPSRERAHFSARFHHWQWTLRATYNGADFYDLFGPTKKSRKGYSLGIQYRQSLSTDGQRKFEYGLDLAGYANLERLPDFQNVSTSFDKLLTLKADLKYENVQKSLGAVDEEFGVRSRTTFRTNYVNDKFFPQTRTELDYGILLPINHSSIWWRGSAGYAYGDRNEPFANFYFGGFGNNWVDYQDEKRYREHYSFPGAELNEISGKNYGRLMMEWALPPIRFRRAGWMSFYTTWSRLALFTSAIVTNFDKTPLRRELANFGAQIDFELVLFTRLASTFSLGAAAAVEKDRRPAKEFMISLKIL